MPKKAAMRTLPAGVGPASTNSRTSAAPCVPTRVTDGDQAVRLAGAVGGAKSAASAARDTGP